MRQPSLVPRGLQEHRPSRAGGTRHPRHPSRAGGTRRLDRADGMRHLNRTRRMSGLRIRPRAPHPRRTGGMIGSPQVPDTWPPHPRWTGAMRPPSQADGMRLPGLMR